LLCRAAPPEMRLIRKSELSAERERTDADADEFGTARAGSEDNRRAQKKRRKHSGVCLIG